MGKGNPTRRPDEAATLRRLIASFGADVCLELRRPLPRDTRQRASMRMQVEEVIAQRYANAEGGAGGFIPPVWSPSRLPREGRVAVIGPSPAYEDARAGQLGMSKASRTVVGELRHHGIATEMVSELTTVFHWTSAGPRANRAPTPAEQDEARADLFDALDAADVDYVLLHGAHAMRAWRTDLRLQDVAGGLYLMQNRWLVSPVNHASAVMRRDGYDSREWQRHIASFASWVNMGSAFDAFRESCVHRAASKAGITGACNGSLYAWDADGVPWCEKHWDEGRKGAARTDKRDAKRHEARQVVLIDLNERSLEP